MRHAVFRVSQPRRPRASREAREKVIDGLHFLAGGGCARPPFFCYGLSHRVGSDRRPEAVRTGSAGRRGRRGLSVEHHVVTVHRHTPRRRHRFRRPAAAAVRVSPETRFAALRFDNSQRAEMLELLRTRPIINIESDGPELTFEGR